MEAIQNTKEETETQIRRLNEIGVKFPNRLPGKLVQEVKTIMRYLRAAGFSVEEIQELCKSRWEKPTIKEYTKNVVTDDETSAAKGEVMKTLQNLVQSGFSILDVENFLETEYELDSKGIKLQDVQEFLSYASDSQVAPEELVKTLSSLKQSGTSAAQLIESLKYKQELDKCGYSLGKLKQLASIAPSYKFDDLLTVSTRYGNIKNMDAQLKRSNDELNALAGKLEIKRKALGSMEEQRKEIEGWIEKYESLHDGHGVTDQDLLSISREVREFGGPGNLLVGISRYKNNQELVRVKIDLENECSEIKKKLTSLRSEVQQETSQLEVMRAKKKAILDELRGYVVIFGVEQEPRLDRGLSMEYLAKYLEAAKSISVGANINPKIKLESAFPKKQKLASWLLEFDVQESIDLALAAIKLVNRKAAGAS